MNKSIGLCRCLLLVAVAIFFAATTAVAQDMAKVAPNNVKVILDNDEVRVMDVHYKTGEKLPMHSHPPNIVYAISDTKVKTTLADGKVMETSLKAGEARWSDKITHANEALVDTHVLVIELKPHKQMMKK